MQQVRTYTRLFCHICSTLINFAPFLKLSNETFQYLTKKNYICSYTPQNAFSLNTDLKKFVLPFLYSANSQNYQTTRQLNIGMTWIFNFFQMTDVFYFFPPTFIYIYIYISYRTNTKDTITNTQDITECFWKKTLIRRQTSMGNDFKMAPVCFVLFSEHHVFVMC